MAKKRKRGMPRRARKTWPLSSTKKAWVVARDGRGHLTGIEQISVSEAKEFLG